MSARTLESPTFRREAHRPAGDGGCGRGGRQVVLLGGFLLPHPRVLRGQGGGGQLAASVGAVSRPAMPRMAARIQAGDGLLEGRRNQCRA